MEKVNLSAGELGLEGWGSQSRELEGKEWAIPEVHPAFYHTGPPTEQADPSPHFPVQACRSDLATKQLLIRPKSPSRAQGGAGACLLWLDLLPQNQQAP